MSESLTRNTPFYISIPSTGSYIRVANDGLIYTDGTAQSRTQFTIPSLADFAPQSGFVPIRVVNTPVPTMTGSTFASGSWVQRSFNLGVLALAPNFINPSNQATILSCLFFFEPQTGGGYRIIERANHSYWSRIPWTVDDQISTPTGDGTHRIYFTGGDDPSISARERTVFNIEYSPTPAPAPFAGSPVAPAPFAGSPVAPAPFAGSPVAPAPAPSMPPTPSTVSPSPDGVSAPSPVTITPSETPFDWTWIIVAVVVVLLLLVGGFFYFTTRNPSPNIN
jgi:hypothetical protein